MSSAAPTGPVVIVGAGQAGVQVADSVRAGGHRGPIVLLGDEPELPYQRPPLSKDYLADGGEPLPLRGERFFVDKEIDFRSGVRVTGIDRDRRTVALNSGEELGYAWLVLATGAAPRPLPVRGRDLDGVLELRSLAHARSLREVLGPARSVVVVGAGFIGLEFAAVARGRGLEVTVLESADRVLARAVSSETGRHLTDAHRAMGTELLLGEGLASLEGEAGAVRAAVGTSGRSYRADLVVLGIGVLPRDDLARAAGLAVEDGIVVDEYLRTGDPAVFAVGDCARFPSAPGGPLHRLESVQNATDQARHVARAILGADPAPYAELPWFWSDQGAVRLQIAGLAGPDDRSVVSGNPAQGGFSMFRFRGDRLVAVESVARPADHVAARRVLTTDHLPTPAQVADPSFHLKQHATRFAAARQRPTGREPR